jgi:hypothetical protein
VGRDGETTAGSVVAMTAGSLSAGAPMAAGEGRDGKTKIRKKNTNLNASGKK